MSRLQSLALALLLLSASSCGSPAPRDHVSDPGMLAGLRAAGSSPARPTGAPAPPATPVLSSLTVEQALLSARRNHPGLAGAVAEVDAATARYEAAALWDNPEAIVRAEQAPLGDGSMTGDADYLVGFSQPIPLGDRLDASRTLAGFERDRAQLALEATRAQVERDVRGAFGTALYAQRVAEVYAELLQTSRRQRDLVDARLQAGDAISAELARIELLQVSDLLEFKHSQALRDQALVSLSIAMVSAASIESVDGDLSAAFDLPSLAQLLDQLDRNPALLAAEADSAAARARVDLAEQLRVPDIRLDLLYRRIGLTDTNALDVGLGVPIRLFNDGRAGVRLERAHAALADARVREARLDLEGTLRDAYVRAAHALEHMQLLEHEILPRTERLVELVEKRRAAGDVSVHELLDARRQWLDARLTLLEALHEVLSAWAGMSTFLGGG